MSANSVCYISHGGGPLPLLGDAAHQEMLGVLKHIASVIPAPSAVIVISAHWEESRPSITSGSNPALIYDYHGFPEAAYHIQYPAPGHPALADEVFRLLENEKMDPRKDSHRGFDHGLFVPLKIMYPQADIPCIQLSLMHSLDARQHIQMGRALSGLKPGNVLVLGSGFSFHNLRYFFLPATADTQKNNVSFEDWLVETCTDKNISEAERYDRLSNWEKAPAARFCHPREEHLLPLHVCYGMAARPAQTALRFEIMGKQSSAFIW